MREVFEFRVMRGDERCASRFEQLSEDGTRQGRAFLRIRPRAEFVEDDERAPVDPLEDVDDVRDVAAERAERLLDGLLVADVGKDGVEGRQFRSALRRDVQSALRHEHEQADRFQ